MLEYLTEVEEAISDSAIGQIKKMKDISSVRCDDHYAHYEVVTRDITQLGDEATDLMVRVAELGEDKETKRMAS